VADLELIVEACAASEIEMAMELELMVEVCPASKIEMEIAQQSLVPPRENFRVSVRCQQRSAHQPCSTCEHDRHKPPKRLRKQKTAR
jgi:hypothetical protein